MTEKEFDQKIEDIAACFERCIETAADHLTRKHDESHLFRFLISGISLAAEIGLLTGAKRLVDGGHRTAAIWCAGVGVVGLVTELVRILVFRRKG